MYYVLQCIGFLTRLQMLIHSIAHEGCIHLQMLMHSTAHGGCIRLQMLIHSIAHGGCIHLQMLIHSTAHGGCLHLQMLMHSTAHGGCIHLQMLMHSTAHGGCIQTPLRESAQKTASGEKGKVPLRPGESKPRVVLLCLVSPSYILASESVRPFNIRKLGYIP